jgi:ribosomal protein L11 methylase PrmA
VHEVFRGMQPGIPLTAPDPVTVGVQDHRATGALRANTFSGTISSGVRCALAPRFAQLRRPGAQLVLAGILDEQVNEVIAAYAPFIALHTTGQRDGWTALTGQR